MNQIEYTIEVTMTPHYWDNETEPYFWSINYFDDITNEWLSKISGWAKTPEDAWNIANLKYKELS